MVYKTDSRDRSYSWVSYDDKTTFEQKIDFANKRGLRGLLIWAIDQDDDNLTGLKAVTGQDIAYGDWNVNDCYITDCQDTCEAGWTTLFQLNLDRNGVGCPNSGDSAAKSRQRSFCCPPWGAPDASKCYWAGNGHDCYGQCDTGDVLMATDNFAGGGSSYWCRTGTYAYCCPATSGAAAIAACEKRSGSDCPSTLPQSLTSLADNDAFGNGAHLCCPADPTFNNCDWHGASTTCNGNSCPVGKVEIYRDTQGNSGAACVFKRQKVFCCDPPYGGSAFLPVPLENLFADAASFPSSDEPVYYEAFDHDKNAFPDYDSTNTDDPSSEPFAWTIMVGAEEDVQSLRRRDGSHLAAFDCPNPDPSDFSTQTVKLACMVADDHNCEDLMKGGTHGTIVRLPEGCGPDEWVRVVSFKKITDVEPDAVPPELVKRASGAPEVYQLRYDYNFRKLRRDGGEIYVRFDASVHPGYWDAIVASDEGAPSKKRAPGEWREFHMDWFERRGFVDGSEQARIAARGESTQSSWWAGVFDSLLSGSQVLDDGGWGVTKTYTYSQVLYSATKSCPPSATASLTATVEGKFQAQLDYGLSLIGTLRKFDFSQAYAYFQLTHVAATAGGTVEANAAIGMQTTVQPLQIDLDPWGGSFNIKGLWQVGPYFDVTAQLQAQATISGKMISNSTIASTAPYTWMYPAGLSERPSANVLTEYFHNFKVTSGEEASITSDGSLTMSLTPAVGFKVVLSALGSSLVKTDIKARFGSEMTVKVNAGSSDCDGANYGIVGTLNAGFVTTDPLPGWDSGTTTYDVFEETWEVMPLQCVEWGKQVKRGAALESRASVVDALFPDISSLSIACPSDITSESSGCYDIVLDNSHLEGMDSVEQGVVPTVNLKRDATLSAGSEGAGGLSLEILAFSRWEDAPDYDPNSLHQLHRRTSDKKGFWVCSGNRAVGFSGMSYWTGSELIQRAPGTPPTPQAYTKNTECDTYSVVIDPSPTVRQSDDANVRYYIAEHVFEWRLLIDFWTETFEDYEQKTYTNPASQGFMSTTRGFPSTATISWCDYMWFWWYKGEVTVNGFYRYPTWHAAAGVIPSKDNGFASELILLDHETNGFKERLFGDGDIRTDDNIADYVVNDPIKAILVCRGAINSVRYMKVDAIKDLYVKQATRVADTLDAIESAIAAASQYGDVYYNKLQYVPFNYGKTFKKFAWDQQGIAWTKIQLFVRDVVETLSTIHLGTNTNGPQGGVQTNDEIRDRIGLLIAEYNEWRAAGWDNPIPASWNT
ncbi:hypothetical protein LQW54_003619 [Pestalotiopsis sp. IQ-011]